MSLKKAAAAIKKNKRFLLTCHTNPEADAIGSELALAGLLKKLGKEALIVNESKVPPECLFLPGVDTILPVSNKNKDFDCAVFLDCSDAGRAGKAAKLVTQEHATINIDHHISNKYFAEVNWVSSEASCTCEMVYQLYKCFKEPIGKDSALQLYSGLVVDTGSFRFNNTTDASHIIAADLIKTGLSPARIYNSLYENMPFKDIKLLGEILSDISRLCDGRIVWAGLSETIVKKKSGVVDLSEVVLTLLRSIKDVELAMVFKAIEGKKNKVRVNFRSQSNFDCNKLASYFGGGGHKNASGTTADGEFNKIKNEITAKAKELMGEKKC